MDEEYTKMILKKLNERKALHRLLLAKKRLYKETEKEIKEIKNNINELDNKISILTPNK